MNDKNQDYITLQNYLKKMNLVQSGGEAKMVIQQGFVLVNDEVETRRGKKLRNQDKVTYQGKTFVVENVC